MTDTDRLLSLLRDAGSLGVHTSDLRRLGVSGNPSQRRADLQARGHTITSTPEPYPTDPRRRGARYRLLTAPETCPDGPSLPSGQQPAASPPPGAAGQLSRAPRCAIYDLDDFDEAA